MVQGQNRQRVLHLFMRCMIALSLIGAIACIAFECSVWPSVWIIRWQFAHESDAGSDSWDQQNLPTIRVTSAVSYDPGDRRALLDIYRPAASGGRPLPVIVWIHGGGYIAGSRVDLASYARVLAADGYAVVAVDYPLAPEVHYPAPVIALNRALAFLSEHAGPLQLDRQRFILAGDSAGAQLAAQVALLVSSPGYAKAMGIMPALQRSQLRGMVLYCGPFDGARIVAEISSSWYSRAYVWSYFGTRQPSAATLAMFSIAPHVTPQFPPAFINVGNADTLAPQSVALAEALRQQGVRVETWFYPSSHQPPLPHEYEFEPALPEAQATLQRVRAFVRRATASP